MQILRFHDRTPSRWKSGRGVTWEYAVHPAGAGPDDFYWRINRAHVAHHVAFSVFPGIERTLTVVAGDAIDLLFPDRRVRLDRTTRPYSFSAEVPIECRIPAGAIDNLNVMTRRGHWTHRVERTRLDGPTRFVFDGDVALVVALDPLRLTDGDDRTIDLAGGDAALFEPALDVAVDVAARGGAGELLCITLDHVARRVS